MFTEKSITTLMLRITTIPDSHANKAPTFTRIHGNVSIPGHKRLQNLGPFKQMVT
jgi:hypothetical protein